MFNLSDWPIPDAVSLLCMYMCNLLSCSWQPPGYPRSAVEGLWKDEKLWKFRRLERAWGGFKAGEGGFKGEPRGTYFIHDRLSCSVSVYYVCRVLCRG